MLGLVQRPLVGNPAGGEMGGWLSPLNQHCDIMQVTFGVSSFLVAILEKNIKRNR
jgi:hypothetical protein